MSGLNKVSGRREAIKSASKVFTVSAAVSMLGYSFPAHAVWTEVAKGIATGIAEFVQMAFEALTELWVSQQKSANDKGSVSKTKGKDQEQDFIVSIENLNKTKALIPLDKQCVDHLSDSYYIEQVKKESDSFSLRKTFSGSIGNNVDPKTRMPRRQIFVGSSGNVISASGAMERILAATAKRHSQDPYSHEEAREFVSIQVADTSTKLGRTAAALASNPDVTDNPVIADEAKRTVAQLSTMSMATHVISSVLTVEETGEFAVQSIHRKRLKDIAGRRDDDAYHSDITNSTNDVALAAELVKIMGERIYVQNEQYHENCKIIALLALQILQRNVRLN